MKNFVLLFAVVIALAACTNTQKKKESTEKSAEVAVLTVDELYANVKDLVDKEVVITGTVSHVCKHSGARCFLMGSNEDMTIRVEAGEDIGTFMQEQLGSELEVVGILKEVMVGEATHDEHAHVVGEAEEDHTHVHAEGEEHEQVEGDDKESGEAEHAEEEGHEIQAEDAEPVYFIEGLKAKELAPAPEVTEETTEEEK